MILILFLLKCIYCQSEILREPNNIAGVYGGAGTGKNSRSLVYGGCLANNRVDMCLLGAKITLNNEDKEEIKLDALGYIFNIHFLNKRKYTPVSFSLDMGVMNIPIDMGVKNTPVSMLGPSVYYYALSNEKVFVIPSFSVNFAPLLFNKQLSYSINCEMVIKNKSKTYLFIIPNIAFAENSFVFGVSAMMMFKVEFEK